MSLRRRRRRKRGREESPFSFFSFPIFPLLAAQTHVGLGVGDPPPASFLEDGIRRGMGGGEGMREFLPLSHFSTPFPFFPPLLFSDRSFFKDPFLSRLLLLTTRVLSCIFRMVWPCQKTLD